MLNGTTVSISARAAADLAYIRSTIEAGTTFTSVSGKATVLSGFLAVAVAAVSVRMSDFESWLVLWLTTALLAAVIGVLGIYRKEARAPDRNLTLPLRFLISLAPAFTTAIILTFAFWRFIPGDSLMELRGFLVALWLLLYGAGVTTAGLISIRPVILLGVSVGIVGLVIVLAHGLDDNLPELGMAAGFGMVHMIAGASIWRTYGG